MTAVPDQSSYLRYLPPVLWRDEQSDASLTLGSVLRIFEKLLTGLDDGLDMGHDDHLHLPLAAEIGALHELFDPWASPATPDRDFLTWLASWLALRFPTLNTQQLWDEYQRRNATAKIAQIYRQRGLKTGLNAYLDLYATGGLAPRVAIDDGARILAAIPQPSSWAAVCGLVTQGPVLAWDLTVLAEGLMRPQCLAVGPDGSLFAGEAPLPPGIALPVKTRVWHFSPTGEYRTATAAPEDPAANLSFTSPQRHPLAPTMELLQIRAIVVAPPRSGSPETVYILEQSGRLSGVPAPYERSGPDPVPAASRVGSVAAPATSLVPIAMHLDPVTGTLLILDRGSGPGTANPPKILTVTPVPFAVTRTPLGRVVEPLSLLVDIDGTLLIGDGGNQEPGPDDGLAGNLVRVDRSTTPWTETLVLPADNAVRAPTGLARTDDGRLFVLDAGLKPFANSQDPFSRLVADPACIFAVDEGPEWRLTRVTAPGAFVLPVGMVASGDRLVVADRGEFETDLHRPSWTRVKPFEFDVVIHWAEPRLPEDSALRHQLLARVVGDIRTVVDEQKPAHAVMNLVTRF